MIYFNHFSEMYSGDMLIFVGLIRSFFAKIFLFNTFLRMECLDRLIKIIIEFLGDNKFISDNILKSLFT